MRLPKNVPCGIVCNNIENKSEYPDFLNVVPVNVLYSYDGILYRQLKVINYLEYRS